MPDKLTIKGKTYQLPIFCPDATRGVVRSLDPADARENTRGIIVNTWHLSEYPGREAMLQQGGIKKLMNYDGLVISDSGGFQVFSLFQQMKDFGKITDKGLVTYTGPKKQHKRIFTPEDSIRMQFTLGSDIVICLDDYTPPEANRARARESVERTVAWAERCKKEYERQLKYWRMEESERPLIFAVVQGHDDWEWREKCAQELMKIGFDGYGLGGAKFRDDGSLDLEWAARSASLTPDELLRYAMGFGKPDEIQALVNCGYQIFDCVLPTRDARHGRLYVHTECPDKIYEFVNINKAKYQFDTLPLDVKCTCHTCQTTTRAYLHHLYKIGDASFYRLATIHNVRFFEEVGSNIE